MLKCTFCHKLKDENEFTKDKQKRNGLRSNCNECKNKQTREYKRDKRTNDREWVKKQNKNLRDFFKKNPDKAKQYYKTKTKEQHLKYMLKRNYNITIEFYNELNEKQGGVCAICKTACVYMDKDGNQFTRRLAVDHCHETGNIRGLLCSSCNGGLGLFKDDIKLLKNTIKYLSN